MMFNPPANRDMITTGPPWCRDVPSRWSLVRNKNLITRRSDLVGDGFRDYELLSLTKRGVINRDLSTGKGKMPASFEAYQVVEQGDIVMCLFDVDETPRTVGRARSTGMITGAYDRFVADDEITAEFLTWFYIAVDDVKGLRPLYRGLRKTVPVEAFLAAKVPLPPADEQAAIVKYLAHANARINRVIRAKQLVARLLAEQALAEDDFDLHQTPRSAEPIRLKYVMREIDERSSEGLERHLSMSQRLGLVPAEEVERTLTAESMANGRLCRKGDIVLNRLKAHLGVFSVAPMDGVVSPDYTVLRMNADVDPHYLCARLRSRSVRPELRRRTKGIVEGFWRLYTPDLLSMQVVLPARSSQAQVVSRMNERKGATEQLLAHIDREISLLQEFWTRLVADVVTGQVDVREVAATLPEPDAVPAAIDVTDDPDELEVDDVLEMSEV